MVSIISPVYNTAPYIRACIDSLKAQTLPDFEVLFVDDHGQDDAIQVAKEYTRDDSRFRFLETPTNAGPGVARNLGIEAAEGQYIAFIDSDDLWHPNFLKTMVEMADAQADFDAEGRMCGSDLTYCQLAYKGGEKDGQVHRNPVLLAGAFTPENKRHFLLHFVTFSVCFLFRRRFLVENRLRFPELRNSEDTHFLTRCLLAARTIACVDQPLYYYCVRESSLSTGRNRKKYRQRLASAHQLLKAYRDMCEEPRLADLNLKQYSWVMYIIYLKKGLAQAVLDVVRNL